jgi:hypothetical protein
MAFHACDTSGSASCDNPSNHQTYLAESDDLLTWTLVSGWTPYNGSVPDLIQKGRSLYIYNPGAVRVLNLDSGILCGSTTVTIQDTSGTTVNFVDPSPILNSDGKIALFYLDSTGIQGDPAGCSTYPCTKNFGSAVEVDGSNGTQFIADSGYRAQVSISSMVASDPDIFQGADADGYVLYISKGISADVYKSATLTGTYASSNSLSGAGVPAGQYDGSNYWYFGGVNSGSGSIKNIAGYRASSLTSGLGSPAAAILTLQGSTFSALGSTYTVDSPGILKLTE